MKINCYSYDSLHHPKLGGGGALRDFRIHSHLAKSHHITFFCGYYPGAVSYIENGIVHKFLGFGRNYFISRISYAILATLHATISRADLYVITYSIFSPVLSFIVKPSKTIIQFFHFTGTSAFKKYSLFGVFPYLAEKVVFIFGKNFITLSKTIAEDIKTRFRRIAHPILIGIDESMRCISPNKKPYILVFGRIDVHMKGLDLVFDIFQKVAERSTDIALTIAGRGKAKDIQFIKDGISSSSYSGRISFIENPSDEKKIELIRNASIVLIPSRYEGWNIVAIEAAANSKPVVASDIPGLSDAVRNGQTGYLCRVGDVSEFAEKCMHLLLDNDSYQCLAQGGFEWARNFDWSTIAQRQFDSYLEVANNKHQTHTNLS